MPNSQNHILTDYENALKEARKSVLTMASLASEILRNSVKGLFDRNEDLLNDAIVEDEEVNTLERIVDREGMEILLRYNPVATDLRSVISAMKISTNLERIADQGSNIARRSRKIITKPEVPETRLIEPIYAMATELFEDSVKAYSEGDAELGAGLYERDKELDELHRKTMKRFMKLMESDVDNLRTYLNLIFIVRCLERVGDHAVNIGEDTVYVVNATDIRHLGSEAAEAELNGK